MTIKFLKVENQFLGTGLQTSLPIFFRNQFLEAISRNQFFIKTQ
jgi:hypothetical protein